METEAEYGIENRGLVDYGAEVRVAAVKLEKQQGKGIAGVWALPTWGQGGLGHLARGAGTWSESVGP